MTSSGDTPTLVRTLFTLTLGSALMLLPACFKAGPTVTTAPVSITLVPSTTTISSGQSLTVTADVYDQSGRGASWTITPLNFGALSKESSTAVTYTAPTSFANSVTLTITATSIADPNITSSVQITATPTSVSLSPPTAQTLNQGQQLPIFANVTNDLNSQGVTWTLSPASGAGSLSNQQPLFVNYNAPAAVSSPTTVTLTATSVAAPTAVATLQITSFASGAGLNVSVINVDGGPVPGQVHVNAPFTSLSICKPGSTTACQNIGGILVDTGSYGLRILQSEMGLIKLSQLLDENSNILENCDSLPDGSFLWGQVSQADVYIAGEFASAVPIQVVSDAVNEVVPDGCSNGGTNLNTPELLGANGILGIGPEPNDCTLSGVNFCDGSSQPTVPNVYYGCPSTGCATSDSPVVVADTLQVANPVPLFNADFNGFIVQLPEVSTSAPSVQGTLTFGIDTQGNNSLGSANVITLDANDHFTTVFNGQSLTSSFLDSGASALLFPSSIPSCPDVTQFYCPPSVTDLSATIQGATQGGSTVDFDVENADTLFSTSPGAAAFEMLGGPEEDTACSDGNTSCVFDWGMPFFYGRSVYTAIDKQSVFGAPPTPWWAY